MTITLPAFTPLEESLFLTLCCRALDNRSEQPILGDAMADEIVRKLDYDYEALHISTDLMLNVTLRAKKLDEVASRFLARHPDAVGLDLGAGLDTRVVRLDPPSTVDWYDVDFPAVASARERLIPERPNAHVVGADVREADWLDAIPTGRPALLVADGSMGFLSRDEFVSRPTGSSATSQAEKWCSTATPRSPSGWPITLPAPKPLPISSSSLASRTRTSPKIGTLS